MIDDRLIGAYVTELEALRRHGAEIAEVYPDIASRLDIGAERSRDPATERIVESTAFLAARLRMLIERSTEELPTALLTMIAPTLLEPVPSMAIAVLQGGSEIVTVPRGTVLEYQTRGRSLLRFVTTMEVKTAPARLGVRRLGGGTAGAEGLAIGIQGAVPDRLTLFVGRDRLSAARLIDALSRDLARIEVVHPGADRPVVLPANSLRFHGYTRAEASLPERVGAHSGHRLVTEFICFSDKFRFISLTVPGLVGGSQIRLWFTRPLGLAEPDIHLDNLFSLNRVPLVNLWPSVATPFEMTGRALEYPVRVDAQRYRQVECHSVEAVDVFVAARGRPERIDPLVGVGRNSGSDIEWGVRRTMSRAGSEVMLYFRGPDYAKVGIEKILISPQVLASNGTLAQVARTGANLLPARSLADWKVSFAAIPSSYRPALGAASAMSVLLGYLQGSLRGLTGTAGTRTLARYLKQFPGAEDAFWIDGLGPISARPVLSLRNGQPVTAANVFVRFDPKRARTESYASIERVLTALLDSQRGLNHVQDLQLLVS